MSRKVANINLNNSVAIIVDGKDEKWYLENIKKHYQEQHPSLKRIKIEPELPSKKKVKELFGLAETKHMEGYKHVVLIVDLDTPNKDPKEFRIFEDLYNKYFSIKNVPSTGRISSKYKWMQNLTVIINNPCLEYWYIIHFEYTQKFFNNFSELKPELQKYLPDYDKNEKYYKGTPDIYTRLRADKGLAVARNNAQKFSPFTINTCKTYGISEMNKLFDFFDSL